MSPEPTQLLTINDDIIEAERRAMEERDRACVEAIKAIHAQGPTLKVADSEEAWRAHRSHMRIERGPGAIAKFSKHGNVFTGWYREGQRSGVPNRRMPIEVQLEAAFTDWANAMRRAVPAEVRAAVLGMRSGASRREKGLAGQIIEASRRMDETPQRERAKRLASQFNCNVEYVRRVLRQYRQRQALGSGNNTT